MTQALTKEIAYDALENFFKNNYKKITVAATSTLAVIGFFFLSIRNTDSSIE